MGPGLEAQIKVLDSGGLIRMEIALEDLIIDLALTIRVLGSGVLTIKVHNSLVLVRIISHPTSKVLGSVQEEVVQMGPEVEEGLRLSQGVQDREDQDHKETTVVLFHFLTSSLISHHRLP